MHRAYTHISYNYAQIHHAAAIGVIDLVSSLDIFRPFPMCKAIDVLQAMTDTYRHVLCTVGKLSPRRSF